MPGARILVTGVNGATGRHLARALQDHHADCILADCILADCILGIGRRPETCLPLDQYYQADLTEKRHLDAVLSEIDPSQVYHLAGVNGHSAPGEAMRVNVEGFNNLVDSLQKLAIARGRAIRLLTIGSAAEIGPRAAARSPVPESVECQPLSEYGQSKWIITRQALALASDGPLQVLVARTFNLLGPGLDPKLAIGNFVQQIRQVKQGRRSKIQCGWLHARRDYLDVRDAADAYVALMEFGMPGQLYNVCTGRSVGMREILEQAMNLAKVEVPIDSDPSSTRPGDLPEIFGDPAKIHSTTPWRPRRTIEQSLTDMLEEETSS